MSNTLRLIQRVIIVVADELSVKLNKFINNKQLTDIIDVFISVISTFLSPVLLLNFTKATLIKLTIISVGIIESRMPSHTQ